MREDAVFTSFSLTTPSLPRPPKHHHPFVYLGIVPSNSAGMRDPSNSGLSSAGIVVGSISISGFANNELNGPFLLTRTVAMYSRTTIIMVPSDAPTPIPALVPTLRPCETAGETECVGVGRVAVSVGFAVGKGSRRRDRGGCC